MTSPSAAAPSGLLDVLPEPVVQASRDVSFAVGTRVIEEGQEADRFWILRSGVIGLDLYLPGQPPPMLETLGPGDLLGWSWLFPPYQWHFGAVALQPVTAREFDAGMVRERCETDPQLGYAVARRIAEIVAQRLMAARTRLLDLYGADRNGTPT